VLLQKGIGYPFDPFACCNRELHAMPSNVSNLPLGELQQIKRRPDNKKIILPSAIYIHIKAYAIHTTFRPI
jgi:hypothetical protein